MMACASQSMISANSCAYPSKGFLKRPPSPQQQKLRGYQRLFTVCASGGSDEVDCNVEECAPDKEVGKVSVEWLAGEKTKVVGTFPPKRKKGWTGYVEKDTAGQTNIYAVEPSVYVSESAISSGSAGTSSEGTDNVVAIAAGLSLISIAAASLILLQVSKNTPQIQTEYSGPPLSYYINEFKPPKIMEAAVVPAEPLSSPSIGSETNGPEVPQVEVESGSQIEAPPTAVVSSDT
ncbi:hypothetical protein QJS04_geneDACA010003 [Acorus gramineus]|uniref:Proline-rich family protein n=1 Tax=Acorus gramineus TaxID=55184 RepID=A0AAV9BKP7_ACOGR|nr:hypothetical protein QJS04_geneDACA010003 [Acorus gramineus]